VRMRSDPASARPMTRPKRDEPFVVFFAEL